MIEIGITAVFAIMIIWSIIVLWNTIPSWGEARYVGLTYILYTCILGLIYFSIFFEGIALLDMFASQLGIYGGWPIWIDLIVLFITIIFSAFVYKLGSSRETFKPEGFIRIAGPAMPIFGVTIFKLLKLLF